MKAIKIFLSLALVLSFAQSTFAATKKTKKAQQQGPDDDVQVYSLPVQQSEIKIKPLDPIPVVHHEFEFTASNWAPRNFQLASDVNGASNFERSGVPFVSVNYITKAFDFESRGALSYKLGLSYMSLQRTGNLGGAYDHSLSETLNSFSVRLGAEYEVRNILPWDLSPVVGLFVLPTWINAGRSELDDGVSTYGLPLEASADLLYRSHYLSKLVGSSDLVLGVGVHDIYGRIEGSDFSGFGVQGVLRLSM